jgi:hypothetical protein
MQPRCSTCWTTDTGVGYSQFHLTAASRFGIDVSALLSHRRAEAAPEIPLRVAIHREVNKLSHNERTKADWPLTRGALFCYRKPDGKTAPSVGRLCLRHPGPSRS